MTFTSHNVCLTCNVWQRDNQILKALIQPLPCLQNLWCTSGPEELIFMIILPQTEAVHLSREDSERKATNGLFFSHVATVKKKHSQLKHFHFAFLLQTLCHSKPPFPWGMTSSFWSYSYKTLLLHPIPLAYAIHMAGREQKTHCSRLMLLFEGASKGMSEDLEYNVEATHLTSSPLRIEERGKSL